MDTLDQNLANRWPSGPVERWSDAAEFRALSHGANIASILVIKVDHIGDFLLSFDALLALRTAFPSARLALLCAPWNEAIARSLDLFDDISTLAFFNARADGDHPTERGDLLQHLPTRHYDLAIDLRADADTRILLQHVHATYRAGFECDDNRMLTICVPHSLPSDSNHNVAMHQSLLMLRLARSVVDVFSQVDEVKRLLLTRVAQNVDFDLSLAQDRLLVVCNTSSGRAAKNWPAERFRRLIRWMAVEMQAAVLLLGGQDQLEETGEILQFCASPLVMSAVGRTSIRQAISLAAQGSIFLGNDSALTHAAARMGVPTIVLMSGIDPTVMWAPRGENLTVLRSPVWCSPCHILSLDDCRGEHACMRNLTEQMVRGALRSAMLSAKPYGQRAGAASPTDVRRDLAYVGWVGTRAHQVPQRYGENLQRYIAYGGGLKLDEMRQAFTHNSRNNRGDLNRFYTLALIFDQIIKEQIFGDIAELGVYKGNTGYMLASLARKIGATAYLLDTFEGFSQDDLAGVDANKKMEFADTSLEQVRDFVGNPNVRFVKGFFPDTSDQIPEHAKFSLVHIDCDLYQPFKAALHFFYDRLVPGGFLIMHDYASLHWDGAERAVDEFFADKPESVLPVPDGSGTVMVRKMKAADRFDNWFVQSKTTGFANGWVRANSSDALIYLAEGWSVPEAWGCWGLGERHSLALLLTSMPTNGIEFVAETTVVLVAGRRDVMDVELLVSDTPVGVWHYDMEQNSAVRSVIIPQELIKLRDDLPYLDITFRPGPIDAPHALDPNIEDRRLLGVGLIRFRQRHL
jgi:ADP-heptose:LPS heptosyltransferase